MSRPRSATQKVHSVFLRVARGKPARWTSDSLFSLIDQAVVSGASFVTTVMLGRWCGASELGTYALAYTIQVFLLNVQMSLISIPYVNQWRRLPTGDQPGFAGCALIQHGFCAALVLIITLLLALVVMPLGFSAEFAAVLFVLAGVLPLMMIREFARRFAFAHLRMGRAMCMDIVVALLQVGGIVALQLSGYLSAATALIVLGLAAAGCGLWLLVALRPYFSIRLDMLRSALASHWRFGRWVLASVGITVIQGYLVHWLLAAGAGTVQTGVFAACMAMVQLSNPLWFSIGNLLEPRLAKTFAKEGSQTFRRTISWITAGVASVAAVYLAILALFGEWLVELLYSGSEYQGHGHLITLLALAAGVGALEIGVVHGLRAMDRPDIGFRASFLALVTTVTAGVILVGSHGMIGGAYAILLGNLVGGIARTCGFIRLSQATAGESTRPIALIAEGEA